MFKAFAELTDTEQSIVIALLEPMTRTQLVDFLALSSTYSARLMPKLQEMGYIELITQPNGKAPLYRTLPNSETEQLFEMKADSLGTVNECVIRWGTGLKTLYQVFDELDAWIPTKVKTPNIVWHLKRTIYRLRFNSQVRDNEQKSFAPSNEELRDRLRIRISQEEKMLDLAKKILGNDAIWSESVGRWQYLADSPITKTETDASEDLVTKFYTKVITTRHSSPAKVEIKEKVKEIVKREPTDFELRNREIKKRQDEERARKALEPEEVIESTFKLELD